MGCLARTIRPFLLLLILVARPTAQSVPGEVLDLADAASVVVIGRIQGLAVHQDGGAIYTYVDVAVARTLKGAVKPGTIVVKQLGGALPNLGLWVADQPRWDTGEEVLLFLSVRPRDGTLTTTGLSRGKWQVVPDLQTGAPVAVNGDARVLVDGALAATVADAAVRTDAFNILPPEVGGRPQSFTFVSGYQGRPARWHEVDDGGTISVDYQNTTDGTVFNAAINGWNAVGARIQLRAGGAFAAPASGCTDFRDRAAIAFFWNDPCGEVPDDGATMGYGGGYFTPGLQKTINGVTFDRYLEGFAIVNQGVATGSSQACQTDAALHVIGHAIGLGDSDQASAVMSRTLRASCSGLAQDDRDGLAFIYPPGGAGGSPPHPPTAITSSVVLNTVTLSWTPASTGGTVQSYIVEASQSPGGPLIASLPTRDAATTLVVPGVQAGTYFVRVRARNVLGTSLPSPETVVNVGPCTAPGAPTGLAYSTADNLVTLTWTPPSGVTQGYFLYAGTAPGQSDALVTTLGTAPTLSEYGAWGTYYVRIAARNSCATGPVSTPDLQVVIAACTSAPAAPTNLQWSRNGNLVTLTWTPPTSGSLPSRYVIHAGDTAGASNLLVFPTTTNATSFVAAAAVGQYYVRVVGRNNCGDSGASNEVVVH
jgi:hypothetical protein